MIKMILAIITAMVAAGYADAGVAQVTKQHKPSEQKSSTTQPRKTALYQGVVQEIDLDKKIVMAGKPKSALGMAFHAADAKLVGYNTLKDIKPGDKVKIEFDAIKSTTIAVIISKED